MRRRNCKSSCDDNLCATDSIYGATVSYVEPESPAFVAGLSLGDIITSVDGHKLRDIIDWRWYTDKDKITVDVLCGGLSQKTVEISRDFNESWGVEFNSIVFDGIKQCANRCVFCFTEQLPQGLRESLYLHDDDYRLSFLSGTFVTFTNLSSEDEKRIITQRISPLHYSLHAVNSEIRKKLIGPREAYGLDAFKRMLKKGICFYVQIVLIPGINDGDVLKETISWAYKQKNILGISIVPLGYTKYQSQFTSSFQLPEKSKAVLESIKPWQERAEKERANAWIYAADEFYCNAFGNNVLSNLPNASFYGDFSMFEDGIGIIRSVVDDWIACKEDRLFSHLYSILKSNDICVNWFVGYAMSTYIFELVDIVSLSEYLNPVLVTNNFFGGNVNVTGLLCGCDIADACLSINTQAHSRNLFIVGDIIFNNDGLTLDGLNVDQISSRAKCSIDVVSCKNVSEFISGIVNIIRMR